MFNMFFQSVIFALLFLNCVSICQQACVLWPCEVQGDSLTFIFVGDFGGTNVPPYLTSIQQVAANGLDKICTSHNCQFYVNAGDNFYMSGVKNDSDPRFQTTFERVYNKPAHQKPWYMIAGNHDYVGNVSAQIVYSRKSPRWNFPDYYYKFSYKIKNVLSVDFLMIDTIILCGNVLESHTAFVQPGPTDPKAAERQWNWIENTLKSAKATYVFVVGHYPVRSKGRKGTDKNDACIQSRMEDLMKKYKVTAYLSGHEHNLEHLQYNHSQEYTSDYVLSGFLSAYDDTQMPIENINVHSLFFYPQKNQNVSKILTDNTKGGFVLGTLQKTQGSFKFYNGDGTKLYYFEFKSRTV